EATGYSGSTSAPPGPGSIRKRRSSQMLVLSRQRDESIIIGDDIVITIVDIRGDKVRLGIEAPTQIPVHRREVYEAIQREQQVARGGNRPASGASANEAESA